MVQRLIKNVLILSALSSLVGCASFPSFGIGEVKPVQISTKSIDKTPLNLQLPDPINTKDIEWYVITPENAEATFAELKDNKVLFAITDQGYQDLAMLIAEIRSHINSQRVIIIKYKDYYETKKEEKVK